MSKPLTDEEICEHILAYFDICRKEKILATTPNISRYVRNFGETHDTLGNAHYQFWKEHIARTIEIYNLVVILHSQGYEYIRTEEEYLKAMAKYNKQIGQASKKVVKLFEARHKLQKDWQG